MKIRAAYLKSQSTMTNKELGELILSTAVSYLGQKEKSQNSGFVNEDFQRKLEATGWRKGESWCAYFAELVYKEAYKNIVVKSDEELVTKQKVQNQIDALFSGGSLQTYANFDKNNWVTRKAKPVPGGIVVWQFGNGWQGHTGIIVSVDEVVNTITTIDGNTNAQGGREGNIVAKKVRKWKQVRLKDGLNIVGYIEPQNPFVLKTEPFVGVEIKDKVISATYFEV